MIERKIVKRLNPNRKEEQKIMKVSKKVPIVEPKLNKARRLIFGIKKIAKQNSAINVKGNIGLQLVFKNGNKLLIGTQRQDAIRRAMKKMFIEN